MNSIGLSKYIFTSIKPLACVARRGVNILVMGPADALKRVSDVFYQMPYDVQAATEQEISEEPWQDITAMLVDMRHTIDGSIDDRVLEYVQGGGIFYACNEVMMLSKRHIPSPGVHILGSGKVCCRFGHTLTDATMRQDMLDLGLLSSHSIDPVELSRHWSLSLSSIKAFERFRMSFSAQHIDSWTFTDADTFSFRTSGNTLASSNAYDILVQHPENQKKTKEAFFDVADYFSRLHSQQLGHACMLAKVVTSTQTLLDQNYPLLELLPPGFVFVAQEQTLGRGRSGNQWVSPVGCLQFSMILHHPPVFSRLVFVQYLVALAMVKSIRAFYHVPVCIKWPNDLYIRTDGSIETGAVTNSLITGGNFKKIGGIIVNTNSINSSTMALIIGCGINVSNDRPTTCLNSVLSKVSDLDDLFTQENVLAEFMNTLEPMYTSFLHSGFTPFLEEYHQHWMHTGQLVTISADCTGSNMHPVKARITGLTDEGYMRAVDVDDPKQLFDLQPGGNRFDLARGLIYKRSAL